MAASTSPFVKDIWYFAGLSTDIKNGKLIRREIAGHPITLGRDETGQIFALSDICPHRAAPLSEGCLKSGTVECPYHGWRFDIHDGKCKDIPALCDEQDMKTENIKVRTFPAQEIGALIWVFLSSDKKSTQSADIAPPAHPFADRCIKNRKPLRQKALALP